MEDLETVLPGGVQVYTLEPVRAKDGDITLHLRVAGPRDRAMELVRNLEHSKHFLLPRITGENADAGEGVGRSGWSRSAPQAVWTSICWPTTTRLRRENTRLQKTRTRMRPARPMGSRVPTGTLRTSLGAEIPPVILNGCRIPDPGGQRRRSSSRNQQSGGILQREARDECTRECDVARTAGLPTDVALRRGGR